MFIPPAIKLKRLKALLDEVDIAKPEIKTLLYNVIASKISNNELDDLALALGAYHSNSAVFQVDIIKKRLRKGNVYGRYSGYKLADDGFTSVDDFKKVSGKYKIEAVINLAGLAVGTDGYKALNAFTSIEGLIITVNQPVMRLFSELKVAVGNVYVDDPSIAFHRNTSPFVKLMASWETLLTNGNSLSRTKLLEMQTQLIEVGDYDDSVTEL